MSLSEVLSIRHPIIQAPMAGVTTPKFVASSAEAGVLGSIGAGYLSAEQTRAFIREVKALTAQPFSVNLFVPEQIEMSEEVLRQATEALQPIRRELGIMHDDISLSESEFDDQIQVIIEENVKICSFTFGLPDRETIQLLKANDVFLIGTATTVEEAILAEKAGMDAVVAQGSEAGGHRGSFHGALTFIPLNELLAAIVKVVSIPFIAAGGIVNKELMGDAFAAGASAVQIGTALLVSEESGAHPVHKKAMLTAIKGATVLTTVFSGKTARGLQNQFTEEMKDVTIAPYPYQNDLTKALRKVAGSQGNQNYMSLWAGENVHLVGKGSVEEILKKFV